jgi:hypothetical protein
MANRGTFYERAETQRGGRTFSTRGGGRGAATAASAGAAARPTTRVASANEVEMNPMEIPAELDVEGPPGATDTAMPAEIRGQLGRNTFKYTLEDKDDKFKVDEKMWATIASATKSVVGMMTSKQFVSDTDAIEDLGRVLDVLLFQEFTTAVVGAIETTSNGNWHWHIAILYKPNQNGVQNNPMFWTQAGLCQDFVTGVTFDKSLNFQGTTQGDFRLAKSRQIFRYVLKDQNPATVSMYTAGFYLAGSVAMVPENAQLIWQPFTPTGLSGGCSLNIANKKRVIKENKVDLGNSGLTPFVTPDANRARVYEDSRDSLLRQLSDKYSNCKSDESRVFNTILYLLDQFCAFVYNGWVYFIGGPGNRCVVRRQNVNEWYRTQSDMYFIHIPGWSWATLHKEGELVAKMNQECRSFRYLPVMQNVVGFKNGFLKLDTMLFTTDFPIGETIPAQALAASYFEHEFTQRLAGELVVPDCLLGVEKALGSQFDRFMDDLVTVFMPRRRRQKNIFIWGPTTQGKSTFIEMLYRIFGDENVGSSNQHATFTLETLMNKSLGVFDDFTESKLSHHEFLRVVGGEMTMITRHYTQAQFIRLQIPVIFISNYEFPYKGDECKKRVNIYRWELRDDQAKEQGLRAASFIESYPERSCGQLLNYAWNHYMRKQAAGTWGFDNGKRVMEEDGTGTSKRSNV